MSMDRPISEIVTKSVEKVFSNRPRLKRDMNSQNFFTFLCKYLYTYVNVCRVYIRTYVHAKVLIHLETFAMKCINPYFIISELVKISIY